MDKELVVGIIQDTILELEKQGKIRKQSEKSAYQKTEAILYNLGSVYKAVDFHNRMIDELLEYGAPKRSKSITTFNTQGGFIEKQTEQEIAEEKAMEEAKTVHRTQLLLAIIETAIQEIRDDWREALEMYYIDGMDLQTIAEEVGVEVATISKRKKKATTELSIILFPDTNLKDGLYQ